MKNVLHIHFIVLSLIFLIQFLTKAIPSFDCQLITVIGLLLITKSLSTPKYFSTWANSSEYDGIKVTTAQQESRNRLSTFARWVDALSISIRILSVFTPCRSVIKLKSSFKYSINRLLFIVPLVIVLKHQPVLVIAEISESEPKCFMLVIVSSISLLSHDLLATVVRENQASSMFTMTSIRGRSCIILTVKYDFCNMFLFLSYRAGLDLPILYDSYRSSFRYLRTKWTGTLIPDSLKTNIHTSFAVFGFLFEAKNDVIFSLTNGKFIKVRRVL